MKPICPPNAVKTLTAPEGEPDVVDLHVAVELIGGRECVVSYWRPSPEQLATLKRDGLVKLAVAGRTHPPLMLDAVENFEPGGVTTTACG